jgi:hypothetical protein
VLIGLAISAVILLFAGRLVPQSENCEATLGLPTLTLPSAIVSSKEEATKASGSGVAGSERLDAGIPLVAYKKLERALADEAVLGNALRGKVDPADIKTLAGMMSEHVTPLTAIARNEIQRMDKLDTIAAVQVSFVSRSAETAREVVQSLADLVRQVVVTNVALEGLDYQRLRSAADTVKFARDTQELVYTNESLQTVIQEIEKLSRRFPSAFARAGREVVDTKDGGYRYLPPDLQLIGLRAAVAENEHKMRLYERALDVAHLRLQFLDQLDGRIRAEFEKNNARLLTDAPGLLRGQLRGFQAGRANAGPAMAMLQADIGGLADLLDSYRTSTRFIQMPTTRRKGRGRFPLLAAGMVVVLSLSVPFLIESWRRRRPAA